MMKMSLNMNMKTMRLNYEELDSGAAGGARDCISEVRESSPWAPLRDCLTPVDVLVLRTTGSKWYNAKLDGDFAE